ncbi:MAG: putative transporter [bacterium]|nr:putative transporter [bacterium]
MMTAFFRSRKWFWWAYGVGLILLVLSYTQVHISVLFNDWYGSFYDMLQKPQEHTIAEFWMSLRRFMYLAIPYMAIATIMSYITRLYSLRWREAITFNYVPRWRRVREEIEGASQRIQEDAYRFAKIIESLGLQAVNAIMTLVAFLPVLWMLSSKVQVGILAAVPGSLVWVALAVSIGGMAISWFVGIKLPGLEYNNQKVEAAFRKELVLGEDDKDHYASLPTITGLFTGIRFNYHRLFLHYGYFDLWLNLYSQTMVIVPFLVAGPGLFTGAMTLGVMMKISNAFGEVRSSLALFISNWTTITELRSIWKRLHEFEANIDKCQRVNS